jgi:hypothetical protein
MRQDCCPGPSRDALQGSKEDVPSVSGTLLLSRTQRPRQWCVQESWPAHRSVQDAPLVSAASQRLERHSDGMGGRIASRILRDALSRPAYVPGRDGQNSSVIPDVLVMSALSANLSGESWASLPNTSVDVTAAHVMLDELPSRLHVGLVHTTMAWPDVKPNAIAQPGECRVILITSPLTPPPPPHRRPLTLFSLCCRRAAV